MRVAGVLLFALAACGGDTSPFGDDAPPDAGGAAGGTGRVAFVDGPGDAIVVDLATGHRWAIEPLFGDVAAMAWRPDGSELAFTVDGGGINVFVAELPDDATASTRRIAPGTGGGIRWGAGGYFVYQTYDLTAEPFKTWIALDGNDEARRLVHDGSVIVLSPTEPRLAFVACADESSPCGKQVVVESATGDGRMAVSSGQQVEPLTFRRTVCASSSRRSTET